MTKLQKAQAKFRKMELKWAKTESQLRIHAIARLDLEKQVRELEDEIIKERGKNTLARVENATLTQRNKDLEEEVKKERGRVTQALDVAEGASTAAGSIGRLSNNLSMTLQSLETSISMLTKEIARRR